MSRESSGRASASPSTASSVGALSSTIAALTPQPPLSLALSPFSSLLRLSPPPCLLLLSLPPRAAAACAARRSLAPASCGDNREAKGGGGLVAGGPSFVVAAQAHLTLGSI
eukprot:scaffold201302_cov30-Tisochrysis_lutea.AAC.1